MVQQELINTDDEEDQPMSQNLTITKFHNRSDRLVTVKQLPPIYTQEHHVPNPNLQRKFTVTIFGNKVSTTVTRRACIVRQWVSRIQSMGRFKSGGGLIVGLGVQWRPPSTNKVATLQLCVGQKCLIFQICRSNSIPWILREFLSDGRVKFVGVRNYFDAEMLLRDYKLNVKNVVELGGVARYGGASMEKLASVILGFDGVRKSERVGRSEWDQRELDHEQVQFACVDASVSFGIGKKLKV